MNSRKQYLDGCDKGKRWDSCWHWVTICFLTQIQARLDSKVTVITVIIIGSMQLEPCGSGSAKVYVTPTIHFQANKLVPNI